jgi:hypothetical protein
LVQIAITYRDRLITIYRNGQRYAQYTTAAAPQPFGPATRVLFGIRHPENGDHFAGAIEEARIYNQALTVEQIAALRPDMPSSPAPWAWWTFDNEQCSDRTGRFGTAKLIGGANVSGGKLVLDGKQALLIATRDARQLEQVLSKSLPRPAKPNLPADIEAARRLRNHLLADPFRPTYRLVMTEGDVSVDRSGAIYWRGRFHLFYIYQERGQHCYGRFSIDCVLATPPRLVSDA